MNRSPLMTVMIRAANKAGRSLRHDFGEVENLQVSRKGPADFVSAADRAAEKILLDELSRVRPDFGWLGEETGSRNENAETRWIVDPLDGTTNFLHGLPHFSVSIAVEHKGSLIAGVIYDPIRDETFCAEKGKGAFLNNRRLHVSARDKQADLLLATGAPLLGRGDHSCFLGQLDCVIARTSGVRFFGSAALDLAYVAAARYDGFWGEGLYIWDIAAGVVLVREAMGKVSGLDGGNFNVRSGDILANNNLSHDTIIGMVQKKLKD